MHFPPTLPSILLSSTSLSSYFTPKSPSPSLFLFHRHHPHSHSLFHLSLSLTLILFFSRSLFRPSFYFPPSSFSALPSLLIFSPLPSPPLPSPRRVLPLRLLSRCLLRLASHNYVVSSTLTPTLISRETSLSLISLYPSLFLLFFVIPSFCISTYSFFLTSLSFIVHIYLRSLGMSSIMHAGPSYSRLPVPPEFWVCVSSSFFCHSSFSCYYQSLSLSL